MSDEISQCNCLYYTMSSILFSLMGNGQKLKLKVTEMANVLQRIIHFIRLYSRLAFLPVPYLQNAILLNSRSTLVTRVAGV